MKTVYVADNGKMFDNENDCREYENKFNEMKAYKSMLFEIIDKCNDMDCDNCPFARGTIKKCGFNTPPFEWEL